VELEDDVILKFTTKVQFLDEDFSPIVG